MAKNEYAKKLQAKREQERQMASEIIQRWTAQLCLDVMTIVLNDPQVMGRDVFGKERLSRIGASFTERYKECIVGLTADVKASYIREVIDRRLSQIWGEDFEKWPERYYMWDDKGI